MKYTKDWNNPVGRISQMTDIPPTVEFWGNLSVELTELHFLGHFEYIRWCWMGTGDQKAREAKPCPFSSNKKHRWKCLKCNPNEGWNEIP
jgi:hypothetical protein